MNFERTPYNIGPIYGYIYKAGSYAHKSWNNLKKVNLRKNIFLKHVSDYVWMVDLKLFSNKEFLRIFPSDGEQKKGIKTASELNKKWTALRTDSWRSLGFPRGSFWPLFPGYIVLLSNFYMEEYCEIFKMALSKILDFQRRLKTRAQASPSYK